MQHYTMAFDQEAGHAYWGRSLEDMDALRGSNPRVGEDQTDGSNPGEGNENSVLTRAAGDHQHTISGGDTETIPKHFSVNYFIFVG